MRTPALLFISALALCALFIGVQLSRPQAPALPTEQSVEEALQTATIDVSEFGGETVTLVNGEASFATTGGAAAPQGMVTMTDKHTAIFKGDVADVYAIVAFSGGGTGTFLTLMQFEYATGTLREIERVSLGDRIIVDDLTINQTAPTAYDVLVSLKERRFGEAMAAIPSQPFVHHYVQGEKGLMLEEVLVGTLPTPEAVITTPLPGSTHGHTITVTGAARGPWFFEASLPVQAIDGAGNVIASVPAQAQGEWMTEELVPFSVALTLPTTTTGAIAIVVKKDNPSGLPENDASFEIPILVQ